jgi:hypothetical protein
VRRLERARRGGRQLVEHSVDVDGVAKAGAERRHGRLGVVARSVETAVDEALQAGAQGEKRAAAASVEAATPTGLENGRTLVVSSTIPANTPTSRPVRSAYESVREISRSMS